MNIPGFGEEGIKLIIKNIRTIYSQELNPDASLRNLTSILTQSESNLKVFPNSPCPLFGRTRRVTLVRRNSHLTPEVVRICQAPVDDTVDTTYLKYAALAKSIGAWGSVRGRCAFCACGSCCVCARDEYEPRDADRTATARRDMRRYDARVLLTYQEMRTMYDK